MRLNYTVETDMEKILDIGMTVRFTDTDWNPYLKVGIIKDLHEWGYDREADMFVVEYYVLWNTGEVFTHYDWDLEVINVPT